jgi:glycosyltransferase involved in cell wall biosynthesis
VTVTQPIHVAVVNSHPIQYFAPLYAYLNRDPSLRVTALYCSDFSLRGDFDPGFQRPVTWDIDLLDGYPALFVGRRTRGRAPRGFWSLLCPRLWREIRTGGYDAIVLHGYNYAACVLAFAAAKSKRLPVLMRSDTHLGLRRPAWRRRLRQRGLSIAYRFVDAFLAIGTANSAYYRSLGVPDSKIFDAPLAVDNSRFMAPVGGQSELKRRWRLPPDRPAILFAGKLTRQKRPDNLLLAFNRLLAEGHQATLLVAGSGDMEPELRSLAAATLPQQSVVFAGFVNQRELPQVYAAADVFVLPAENESWGLAVNEAMCAGLPIVVSDQVGCAPDLVKHGVNGYIVPTGDVGALADALVRLIADGDRRRRMGAASLGIVNQFSYFECRRGLTAALARVLRHEPAGERRLPAATSTG